MEEEKEKEQPRYITRLMDAKCNLGSMTNKLNLPKDHGIIFHELDFPLMNANDFEPDKHIVHFGRCTSNANPKNHVSLESIFLPGSKYLKSLMGCDGCKCKPKILKPWTFANDTHLIEGAPALTLESKNTCFYGGEIKITLEVEEANAEKLKENEEAGDTDADTPAEEKDILDTLPENMQNRIDTFVDKYRVSDETNTVQALAGNGAAIAGLIVSGVTNVMAGMAGFAITSALSHQNFNQNLYQSVPVNALNESGNIADTSWLSNFNIGHTTLSYADCGCSAIYNALNSMGQTTNLANIIRHTEEYAIAAAVPVGGALVPSAMSILNYFDDNGYKTDVAVMQQLPDLTKINCDSVIVGYLPLKSLTASFQMIEPGLSYDFGEGTKILMALSK